MQKESTPLLPDPGEVYQIRKRLMLDFLSHPILTVGDVRGLSTLGNRAGRDGNIAKAAGILLEDLKKMDVDNAPDIGEGCQGIPPVFIPALEEYL